MMDTKKVWFVTETAKRSGISLVKTLLNEGYRVAATTPDLEGLQRSVGAQTSNQWLPIQVDLVNGQSIQNAIAETISYFGQIDVIVNNPRLWKNWR